MRWGEHATKALLLLARRRKSLSVHLNVSKRLENGDEVYGTEVQVPIAAEE